MQLKYIGLSAVPIINIAVQIREVRVGTASVYRPYLDMSSYQCRELDNKGRPAVEMWPNQSLVDGRYMPGRDTRSMNNQGDYSWAFDVIVAAPSTRTPKVATIRVSRGNTREGRPVWMLGLNGSAIDLFRSTFADEFPADFTPYQVTEILRERYNMMRKESRLWDITVSLDTSSLGAEFIVKAAFKSGTPPTSLAQQIIDQVTKGD